jgi:hypothetical protein
MGQKRSIRNVRTELGTSVEDAPSLDQIRQVDEIIAGAGWVRDEWGNLRYDPDAD